MTEYTEDDLRYGDEHKDKRYHHRLINEELANYSWKLISDFDWMFKDRTSSGYILEVLCKEYVEEQEKIKLSTKDNPYNVQSYYYVEHIRILSPEDFWIKWNRFKKMKAFL